MKMSLSNVIPTASESNIASVLISMLLKAKKYSPFSNTDNTSSQLPGKRINIEEVESLPRKARLRSHTRSRQMHKKLPTFDDVESPKILDENTMPLVHDRLPDPELWKKLDFDGEESDEDSNDKELNLEVKKTHRVARSVSPVTRGVVRYKQLYCRTGFHLQILPSGHVTGTRHDHDSYAILEFKSISIGVVSIRGLRSGLYLTMDSRGQLYGSERLLPESYFSETILENYYNTYSTIRQRNNSMKKSCYLALGKSGHTRGGCRSKKSQKFTHFLPRDVYRHKVPHLYTGVDY